MEEAAVVMLEKAKANRHSDHSPFVDLDGPHTTVDLDADTTFAVALARLVEALGVRNSFGVVGGGVAPFAEALLHSSVHVGHFRHEGGAAFAAAEASLATDRPAVLFVTLAPGFTNALTGIAAARAEGAHVVVVSGLTPSGQRGRWGGQETSSFSLPQSGLFSAGPIFDYAATVDQVADLTGVASALARGMQRPGGFIAHLSLPAPLQTQKLGKSLVWTLPKVAPPVASPAAVESCARLVSEGSTVLWVGFGARKAADGIVALAERLQAPVMVTPRGKGTFPESHPLFLGVTGLGGHANVQSHLKRHRPDHLLVLGTRMGEYSTFWDTGLMPSRSLIHVDLDDGAFAASYPDVPTVGVKSEIGAFVEALDTKLSGTTQQWRAPALPEEPRIPAAAAPEDRGPVRPSVLMAALQRLVVEPEAARVLAEPGSSFTWVNQRLSFDRPLQYRTSMLFASMGHTAAGVVGTAIATGCKALAVVGDGALLMNNEMSSAVRYGAPAVWVVLNDGEYGLVRTGMTAQGFDPVESEIPQADFAAIARGMGADGVRVERETDIDKAIHQALAAEGPFVVDVLVDRDEPSPSTARIQSLIEQGVIRGR